MRTTITIEDGHATRTPAEDGAATAMAEAPAQSAGSFDAPAIADPAATGQGPGPTPGSDGAALDAGTVDPGLVEIIEAARAAGLTRPDGPDPQAPYGNGDGRGAAAGGAQDAGPAPD